MLRSINEASLSKLLARAQSGEVIKVTSHQKPIARIVGIPKSSEDAEFLVSTVH